MSATIEFKEVYFKLYHKIYLPLWQKVILLCVLGYEAAGCLSGGILLILAPDGRLMQMPVEIMNGAFIDFRVPGMILFGLGIINTAAFIAVIRKKNSDWFLACTAMGALAIWFWVEIAILQEVHWLHLMWGLPVILGGIMAIRMVPFNESMKRNTLLLCGIFSSALYIAVNIIVAGQWEAYNSWSQTVSELSAVNAPTRKLWVILCIPYTLLIIAFAWGIWKSAIGNRRLRIAGVLFVVYGVLGIFWPFAPMHLRETLAAGGGTFSDTLHITLAAITQVIFFIALGFAGLALGKSFLIYTLVTFVTLMIFGILTFIEAPHVAKNEPTPLIGIWERINIGVFLVWVIVLAIVLMRRNYSNESQI